jgi:hypothetical protein
MSKCLTVLGFETVEDRVVLSASVGGMDFDSLPYMEQQGILQGVDDGTANEGITDKEIRYTTKGFGFIESEEQDLFQKSQTLLTAEYDHGDSINFLSLSRHESYGRPLLIIAEDIEGEALAADSSAIQDGLSNTIMVGEVYGGVPYHIDINVDSLSAEVTVDALENDGTSGNDTARGVTPGYRNFKFAICLDSPDALRKSPDVIILDEP